MVWFTWFHLCGLNSHMWMLLKTNEQAAFNRSSNANDGVGLSWLLEAISCNNNFKTFIGLIICRHGHLRYILYTNGVEGNSDSKKTLGPEFDESWPFYGRNKSSIWSQYSDAGYSFQLIYIDFWCLLQLFMPSEFLDMLVFALVWYWPSADDFLVKIMHMYVKVCHN